MLVTAGTAHGQTTNVWSGATSTSLTLATNYDLPRSVNADGNDTATFVFGRVATTRSTLSASGEFKAKRFEFESTAGQSFNLSSGSSSYFNFVGANNGIFQNSDRAQRLSTGIKISDGPLTLGGNGVGLVTLGGTSNNDYGSKGLTKTGSSAFFIDAPGITSTGVVEINGGVLALRSGTTLAGGAIRLRGGVLAASGTFSRSLGTGSSNINFGSGGGGFAAYGNPLTVSTGLGAWSGTNAVPNGAPLILGAGIADNVVTLSGTLNLGTSGSTRQIQLIDNPNSASDRAVVSGVISGSANLQVTGTGHLTLAAVNTYTGTTTVSGGTLAYGITNALSTGALTIDGGVLDIATFNDSVGTVTLNSGSIVGTTGTLTTTGSYGVRAGSVSAKLSGAVALGKTTSGTVVLSGSNSYTGGTSISDGVLRAANGNALGTIAGGVTVSSGAALELEGNVAVGGEALTLNGTGISTGGALRNISGSNTYGGAITFASAARIAADAGSTLNLTSTLTGDFVKTFGGAGTIVASDVVSGNAGITMAGSGTLTLSAANTFSGGTRIEGGDVRVSADANLGTGGLTLAGGRLVATESFTLGSSRQVVVASASTLDVAADRTLTFDGDLSGGGPLDKTGDGVLALGGGSTTYTGRLTVSDGELRLTAANVLVNATISQTGGTLSLAAGGTPENPAEVVLPNLAGSGGHVDLPANVVAVLVYDGTDDVQTYEGRLRGDGGIRKHGTGRLSLTNDNDFVGTAEVTQGTLVVEGTGAIGGPAVVAGGATLVVNGTARGPVQIESGGVLEGAGVIAGLATVSGTHRPGNSPGLQTFTSGLFYGSGSTFEWDLLDNTTTGRGTIYDAVDVTGGQLTIDPAALSLLRFNLPGSLIDWNDTFWDTERQWLVFDNAIPPSGGFGLPGFTVDGFGNSLTSIRPGASFAWQQQGNDLLIVYAVPEPTTLGLAACAAAGGAALAVVRRGRRRRQTG